MLASESSPTARLIEPGARVDWAEATDQAGELRPVTSLFADVVGSTSLGERLSVSEVRALIGECVSRMCEAIEVYGGVVGALMGDGVAAFFGLEATREDDPLRATRAALEIRRVMAAYSHEVEEAWGISDFTIRVGINHGWVSVGPVGGADPQLLALGDPINVAARLQSVAKPGGVLLGGAVAERVASFFETRSVGMLTVKGRQEPVEGFELLDERVNESPRSRGPFVGRDRDLDALRSIYTEVADGRGNIAIVSGDAGIGKSRLIEELRLALPLDAAWLQARFQAGEPRLPYEPFAQPLRSWLGCGAQAPPIETRVRLGSKARGLLGEAFDDVAPHLSRLLGVSLGSRLDRRHEGLPVSTLSAGMFSAYRSWLSHLAEEGPVVLVLEGFEAANEVAARFAAELLPVCEISSVLILIAMRPTPESPAWAVRTRALDEWNHRSQEIRLSPLHDGASERLARTLSHDGGLDDRLIDVVVTRAEGNPLFIEELVAAVSSQEDATSHLPDALESLLLSRIGALPEGPRLVLQAGAILGRTFDRTLLHEMRLELDLQPSVDALLRSDIVRERGRASAARLHFRHGLIREAAMATLTPSRHAFLARRAVAALERLERDREDEDLELMARLYREAGDPLSAAERLAAIADRLRLVFRFEEASQLLEQCSQLVRGRDSQLEATVGLQRARVFGDLRRFEEAQALLRECRKLATSPAVVREIDLELAATMKEVGNFSGARALLEPLVRGPIAEQANQALVLLCEVALGEEDLAGVQALLDDFELPPDAELEVRYEIASVKAGLAARLGEFGEAEREVLQATLAARRLGSVQRELIARRRQALVYLLKGAVGEAYELGCSVQRRYEELGCVAGQLENGANLLRVAYLRGEVLEGHRLAARLERLSASDSLNLLIRANALPLKFEVGLLEETIAEATLLLDRSDAPGWMRVCALQMLAAGCMDGEEIDVARARLMRARSIASSEAGADEVELVLGGLLELAAIEGDAAAARELIDEMDRLQPTTTIVRSHADRLVASAMALWDRPRARAVLEVCLHRSRQMGLRLEEARVRLALGSLDPANAAEHFAEAERIFEACGCVRGLKELDEARAGVGTVLAG